MPWKVRKRDCKQKSTGKSGTHVVVKEKRAGGQEQESCHTSEPKAQAARRARYASKNESFTTEAEVRSWVRRNLQEAIVDVVSLGLRIKIPDAARLEDIYTKIRGLKNVISVRQEGEQNDIPGPMRYVNIFVTFEDSADRDVYNLKKDIRSLDDVEDVVLKNYEGRRWIDVKKSYTGGRASQSSTASMQQLQSEAHRELTEAQLRRKVRAVLLTESLKAKAQELTAALNAITGDARVGVGRGAGDSSGAHFRIRTDNTSTLPTEKLSELAKQIVDEVFAFGSSTVANVGKANSKMYDTYRVTNSETGQEVNIIFTGTITSGKRGGGYEYEEVIDKALKTSGAQSGVGTDTTLVDVFIETSIGPIGIEVKGAGGKFGEPALHYDYGAGEWIVPRSSRSKENAQLVADLINAAKDPGLIAWTDSIKQAWDADHPDAPMEELAQITDDEYAAMRAQGISQAGPKVKIDIQTIIDYYIKKKASYIQIQGKGLYTIKGDPLDLGATSFAQGMSGLPVTVRPGIMTMGRRKKKVRASMELPYHKGTSSSMDLERPEDAKRFAAAAQGDKVTESFLHDRLRSIIREVLSSL